MSEAFEALVRILDGAGGEVVPSPQVAVVELRGPLDGRASAAMYAAWVQLASAGVNLVLLDFAEVGYVNSTGIALVVALLASAREDGAEVRACALSDHYQRIFEITRITDFITIHPDRHAALTGAAA